PSMTSSTDASAWPGATMKQCASARTRSYVSTDTLSRSTQSSRSHSQTTGRSSGEATASRRSSRSTRSFTSRKTASFAALRRCVESIRARLVAGRGGGKPGRDAPGVADLRDHRVRLVLLEQLDRAGDVDLVVRRVHEPARVVAHPAVVVQRQSDDLRAGGIGALADERRRLGLVEAVLGRRVRDRLVRLPEQRVVPCDLLGRRVVHRPTNFPRRSKLQTCDDGVVGRLLAFVALAALLAAPAASARATKLTPAENTWAVPVV